MASTILVADDDPLTRRVLQHYLERAGFSLIKAQNGGEAVKRARCELPQLIICDVMMPDMDGWTVLRQLQETEETKAIPVILLSGNPELRSKDEPMPSAAVFLAKPINADQLLGMVKRLIPKTGGDVPADNSRK